MIRHRLGREHIGESNRHILRTLRDAINASPMRERYTREIRHQTYRAGIWYHRENRMEYTAIMSGKF